jgi:hypothetical protein
VIDGRRLAICGFGNWAEDSSNKKQKKMSWRLTEPPLPPLFLSNQIVLVLRQACKQRLHLWMIMVFVMDGIGENHHHHHHHQLKSKINGESMMLGCKSFACLLECCCLVRIAVIYVIYLIDRLIKCCKKQDSRFT